MGDSRGASFLVSLFLHTAIIAAIIFWPVSRPPLIDLGKTIDISGVYTIGGPNPGPPTPSGPARNPGKTSAPPDVKKPDEGQSAPKEATPPPKPDTNKTPDAASKPADVKEPAAKPKPVEEPPKKENPDAVPVKDPEAKEAPKPTEKKPEDKKPEDKKPEAKPGDKPSTAKPDDKKLDPKAAQKALDDLAKTTGGKGGSGKGKGSDQDILKGDLADLAKEAGAGGTGSGPGSGGGDGRGQLGSYNQSTVSRIKENREGVIPADGRKRLATYSLDIAPDGTIISAKLVARSGDSLYDSMNMRAIQATRKLEPTPDGKPLLNYLVDFTD